MNDRQLNDMDWMINSLTKGRNDAFSKGLKDAWQKDRAVEEAKGIINDDHNGKTV